jgi:anti-sigma factor RsiW
VSPHLGDDVAAYVDGQLDYARRERALGHLSRCAACRAAVEHERRVKVRVQTLPGAEPSAALLSALTRMPGPPAGAPVAAWPTAVESAWPWQRARALVSPEGRAARGGLLLAGAGTVAAGVLGLAYVVGGATAREPGTVSPPVGQFGAEFAGAEQQVPLSDPAMDAFSVIGSRTPMGRR